MNYEKLGKYVESLMVDYIKGEIDGNDFTFYVNAKIEELKNNE